MSRKRLLQRFLAVLLALGLWQLIAMSLRQPLLLCTPADALRALLRMAVTTQFWRTVSGSLLNILLGFLAGGVIAVLLAAVAARFTLIEDLLWPFTAAVKSVPVVSFIIMLMMLMSSRRLPIVISAMMSFPILYQSILSGLHSSSPELNEMAHVFRLPLRKRIACVTLPQLESSVISACRTAIGLSWKAGVAAEVLAIADNTIGEKLYRAKITFETCDLFAWTAAIVLLSMLVEKLFTLLLRRGFRCLERP